MVSTAQAASGIGFEDINNFNGHSSVTTAVYEPSNQLLLFGRNIFAPGGIGRDNFKLQIQLFLSDMQTFIETRRVGAKSVAFSKTPDVKSKLSSITSEDAAPSARSLIVSDSGATDVEIAIANSLDVDFLAPKE